MGSLSSLVVLTLAALVIFHDVHCTCVLYGICHHGNGRSQSCLYNGEPIKVPFNETTYAILNKVCPTLTGYANTRGLCCNVEQIYNMNSQYEQAAALFKRCPSCMYNLALEMCYSTCSPDQTDFIEVTGFGIDEITLKRYVTSLTVYASSEFLDGAYRSCATVAMPSAGKMAMDAACGQYTAATCTADRWFAFQGDPDQNSVAPFIVNFKRQDVPFLDFSPLNPKTYKCTEAPSNVSAACSCIDCPSNCPVTPGYSTGNFDFQIVGVDGVLILTIIGFVLFLTSFGLTSIYCRRKGFEKKMTSDENREEDQVSVHWYHHMSVTFEGYLEKLFYQWGKTVASHPTLVLALASWIIVLASYGIKDIVITTDPIQIWATPSSTSRIQKDYFDSTFGPFYRSEQIFFQPKGLDTISHPTSDGVLEFGPVFHRKFLLTIFELQQKIEAIPGLVDVCYAPLSSKKTAETLKQCTVQSVWGFFQNDLAIFNKSSTDSEGNTVNYLNILHKCLMTSLSPDCLAPYGGNIQSQLAVGDFLQYGSTAFDRANALVVTYIVSNHLNETDLQPALEWETKFIELLKNWSSSEMPEFMDISFRSERSIQDELIRESTTEVYTIVISYILMFLYISVALGSYKSFDRMFFVNSKIMLGLGGVVVVLLSVSSSVGIFGYFGVPTTLLVIEVIPFLVLAVGVDNMFILVKTFTENVDYSPDVTECMGHTLRTVGPSVILTTISEATCFAIGGWTDMPAVKTFANYATVALLINFFLQMTVFVAFLSMNERRTADNRLDVFCCFAVKPKTYTEAQGESWVNQLIKNFLAPAIFKRGISEIIIVLFVGCFCANLAVIPRIEPGLDQALSMPEDSYVLKYFEVMNAVLSIGPPVYFVLKTGLDLENWQIQNKICGGLRCNSDSLNTQIYSASQRTNVTYIDTAASSWLDDYNDWASVSGCCKTYPNGSFCPHNSEDISCTNCPVHLNEDDTRPTTASFRYYLPFFLQDNPDSNCAKGGHAAYNGGVNYVLDNDELPLVTDSYFMAFHSPLKTSRDYYTALKMAREVGYNITSMLRAGNYTKSSVEVFPYSVFYVFYEQYLTIWKDGITSILLSLGTVFLVTLIFTGFDIVSSLVVLFTLSLTLTDLAGLMYWWGIDLNAITLVNLVMAIGISVEFCSHIVQSFRRSTFGTRKLRAKDALQTTGAAVFSGITLTKFIGIGVLAFSRTKVFQVFYFRMYLGMVLYGAAHGLIFLPIILSFVGTNNKANLFLRALKRRE